MNYNKITFCLIMIFSFNFSFAGNEDRAGSAGATELLINPWAKSSSWGSAGISSVNGEVEVTGTRSGYQNHELQYRVGNSEWKTSLEFDSADYQEEDREWTKQYYKSIGLIS